MYEEDKGHAFLEADVVALRLLSGGRFDEGDREREGTGEGRRGGGDTVRRNLLGEDGEAEDLPLLVTPVGCVLHGGGAPGCFDSSK